MKKITLLKTVAIALFLLMGVGNAWGQITIAIQDFDAANTLTYTNNGGDTYTGKSGTGDRPASSDFYVSSSTAFGTTNGSSTITFENQTGLDAYINKFFEFRLASWSLNSTGNGADAGDIVTIALSIDGGVTWSNELRVLGYSNAYWHYTTGTGEAIVTFDGDNTPIDFQPESGGNRTTDGYSTVKINLADAGSQASLRITMINDNSNERWTIDDVILIGTATETWPDDPASFTATASSSTQINLAAIANDANDNILVAFNSENTFGTPSETYSVGDPITGGGTVHYIGNAADLTNHTSLDVNTTYYYKAWSFDGENYSIGIEGNAATLELASPLVTATTDITTTSFTANWNTTSGANSYRLDVSAYEDFAEAGGDATDLFISEYIEGNSNNKAIEIFNGTGSSVDLSDYSLKKQVNGAGDFGSELTLVGLIDNNATYVIVYNQANTTLESYADLISSSSCLTFNGNDAVALFKSGVMIDVVGVVDQVAPDWGANVTLVRKSNISGPSTEYDSNDWDSYATDTFEHLGSHTFSGGSTPSFVDGYDDLVVNGTSQSVSGLDPNTTYYYRVRATNGSETSENSNTIEVTTNKDAETVSGEVLFSGLVNVGEGTVVTVSSGNLTIDAEASFEDLVVEVGATVDVDPDIGLLINGDLHLKSPSGNGAAASFIDKGTTLVGGNYIIERHLDAYTSAEDGWHLLAFPFEEDMAIAGSDFAPVEGDDDLYGWDEPAFTWLNYFQDNPVNFQAGKGYLVAYKTSASMRDFTADGNTYPHISDDLVLIDNASRTNDGGWHLVGNSFLSAVTWDTENEYWLADNIEPSAHVLDVNQSGNYLAIDKGETIQALQGFFVRVTADGDNSLFLPENARTHSSGTFAKASVQNALEMKVTNDVNGYFDKTKIKIQEGASQAYDAKFDGSKLKGFTSAPQLYTVTSDAKELAVNAISNNDNEVQIPLHFEARFDASYTIKVEDNTLPEGVAVYMTDLVLNKEINLNDSPTYTFTASEGDNPNRFLLHFGAVGLYENANQSSLRAYTHHNTLYVQNSLRDAAIRVIDIQGRLLLDQKLNGTGLQSLPLDFPAGVYMVQLLNSKEHKSVKVIVE